MAKRKLPRGIREKANGSYEARATVNGTKISICGKDLDKLISEFDAAKEQAGKEESSWPEDIKREELFLGDNQGIIMSL